MAGGGGGAGVPTPHFGYGAPPGDYGAYGKDASKGAGKPPRYEPYDKDFFSKDGKGGAAGKGASGAGGKPKTKGWARSGADGEGGNPNDIPVGSF